MQSCIYNNVIDKWHYLRHGAELRGGVKRLPRGGVTENNWEALT